MFRIDSPVIFPHLSPLVQQFICSVNIFQKEAGKWRLRLKIRNEAMELLTSSALVEKDVNRMVIATHNNKGKSLYS